MDVEANKRAAVDFLAMVMAKRIDEAYAKHVDPKGRHHNAYFAAGMDNLRAAMKEAHDKNPETAIFVKHVVGEGDLVAVHSHVKHAPAASGVAVVLIFRFQAGKVVELWDIGQPVPADLPNKDGMF